MKIHMIADYHTHTNIAKGRVWGFNKIFGDHAKGTILENARYAEMRGLKEIAITDHGYNHAFIGMKVELYKRVREEIDEVNYMYKKKKSNFRVLLGVEGNIANRAGDIDVNDKMIDYLDIICAGYHPRAIKSLDIKKNYTEAAINAITKYPIAILTHPIDKANPDLVELGKVAAKRNTAFEINRNHKNISVEDIRKLKKMGVVFSLGSDSHHSNTVGEFGRAYDIAVEAGLTNDDIINANGKAYEKIKFLK